MFAIGDSLREARHRRGLSPADVMKGIRIRERYLTALEEERWDMLPGEAYTKGFLRTYAEFLGLDGNLYIDEYNARIAHHDEEPALVPGSLAPAYRTGNGALRTVVAVLALGALVAGVAAWRLGGSGRPAAQRSAQRQAAATKHTAAVQPAATRTTLAATRGPCWILVRVGGPHGRILFQRNLQQGQTLHYGLAKNLWIRLGRPDVMDVTVGGRRVNGLPATPANLLLTPAGAQAA